MEAKGSEAQGRHRKVGSEASVEQIPGRGRDGGIALAILLRRALGRQSAGEPQRRRTGEVKAARRRQLRTPHRFLVGAHLWNRRMRTRIYGGVAEEERRLSPLMPISSGISP